MDGEGENLTVLLRKTRGGNNSATGRRERELKDVPGRDRRLMRGRETKNTQLNIKVTATFKDWVTRAAIAEGKTLAAYVEDAVIAYRGNGT